MTNIWKQLQSVLPAEKLRIGTITSLHSNGTVTCSLASGGSLTVRGTGSVGDVVFIYAGEIRQTVSGLTTFADTDV